MRETNRTDELPKINRIDFLNTDEYLLLVKVECKGEPYGVPLNYIVKDDSDAPSSYNVSFNIAGNKKVLPNELGTLCQKFIFSGEVSPVNDDAETIDAFREFFLKHAGSGFFDNEEAKNTFLQRAAVARVSIDSIVDNIKK